MFLAVSAAQKDAAWFQDSCDFRAGCVNVLTVEENVICEYQIKGGVLIGNCLTVKSTKRKSGIPDFVRKTGSGLSFLLNYLAQGPSGVPQHPARYV